MGQQVKRMLLGMVAAALACAASEGIEWNSKGLELYRAAHYPRPKRCTARRSMRSTAMAKAPASTAR